VGQAPHELAMNQGANKESGSQQGALRASNEPGSQKSAREAAMSQGASNEPGTQ